MRERCEVCKGRGTVITVNLGLDYCPRCKGTGVKRNVPAIRHDNSRRHAVRVAAILKSNNV